MVGVAQVTTYCRLQLTSNEYLHVSMGLSHAYGIPLQFPLVYIAINHNMLVPCSRANFYGHRSELNLTAHVR